MPKFEQPPTPEELKESSEQFIEYETTPNERQQNKLIKILETGDYEFLSEPEVSVRHEERKIILERIKNGEISDEEFQEIQRQIKPPWRRDKMGLSGLSDEQREWLGVSGPRSSLIRRLENNLSGRPNDLRADEGVAAAERIIIDYSTPQELESRLAEKYSQARSQIEEEQKKIVEGKGSEMRLDGAKAEERRQRHVIKDKALRELMHQLYGKRQEYWEQIKLLKREAAESP